MELIDFINEITGDPEPPTDLDELRYQSLRLWFVDHQDQFVPLWEHFYKCQGWALHEDHDKNMTILPDTSKYLKNPFLYFYGPENLYRLAQQFDLQCGIDIWEPSEYRASIIRPILVRTGEIMVDFVDWIGE